MRKAIITITILALLTLAFFAGFTINGNITAQAVSVPEEEYTFTKAVCGDNRCVDVKITCKGDSVVDVELASEVKEFSPNWADPRTESEKNKLCG